MSLAWQGTLLAIQPRIRLTRSFDERSHTYLGYALRLDGAIGGQHGEFLVGIGSGTQGKHHFRAGDIVQGESVPVADPRTEPVDFYKTVRLKLLGRGPEASSPPPPWLGVPPELPVYRERGHRRLDAQTYESKCRVCLWGCRMPVDMTRRGGPLPLRDILLRAEVLPALPGGGASQGARTQGRDVGRSRLGGQGGHRAPRAGRVNGAGRPAVGVSCVAEPASPILHAPRAGGRTR